jgi:predicted CoA-substrate-specific enzyme activase
MEALGICVGASTISLVRLADGAGGPRVVWARTRAHGGDSRGVLLALLSEIPDLAVLRVAATGRKFKRLLALPSLSEPEAVELAAAFVLPPGSGVRVVLSAGGETFMAYHLDDVGRVQNVLTGNKCASGTGEFLLQQLGRMGLDLDDLAGMSQDGPAHKVSGRCSVFCKSDCTHALNKGVPRPLVVAGLARMMAGKCIEIMKRLPRDKVLLVGGCSRNPFMVRCLREKIAEVIVPEAAPWFEALGAGLWALGREDAVFPGLDHMFREVGASFVRLPPLSGFRHLVDFKSHPRGKVRPGERVVLGLDVGSTTTKGVLVRLEDRAILAADYLRTSGDPVGAARQVYASLERQTPVPVDIVGLGVTGSGRAIAGLHAGTGAVINEIIAHAAAAVHFDPGVDTIFEIGGQDAKYTAVTNGVPSDYAMNEACSAGTGSFLEESAKETLGLSVDAIGDMAFEGENPPNFNDQCAAFISSDIKIAIQEGVPLPDIVAGLVYSICLNYDHRVKGNRPVGDTVFMQGGVCYNPAVPVAMAALTGKRIVVPPEPGLMGAFGVALETMRRLDLGLVAPGRFDLRDLASREVVMREPFFCKGGPEGCDRGCEIARIEIDGRVFPFGGICNRYDAVRHAPEQGVADLDWVAWREKRLLRDLSPGGPGDPRPTVGMNRSFLVHTYFPLFNAFFRELGFRLMLPENLDSQGVNQRGAAFCFPGELAHGYMADLLARKPDWLFLPHLRSVPLPRAGALGNPGADHGADGPEVSCTCVLVQGEPYYLKSAFRRVEAYDQKLLSPVLNLARGVAGAWEAFVGMAVALGRTREEGRRAFELACQVQMEFQGELKLKGQEILDDLDRPGSAPAVVLFGRPYNAFTSRANKGIPAKFASRGVRILPCDMLPWEDAIPDPGHNMYWGLGRMILRASRLVAGHQRLFGAYITNFSCGPDSFLLGYFRDIMGRKPSLTLELDSHTADAGIETRIEAFLDITRHWKALGRLAVVPSGPEFSPARMEPRQGVSGVVDSSGQWLPLTHDRVRLAIPSMGRYASEMVAAGMYRAGIRGVALAPCDEEGLKLGRGRSSCKECLPLQLTVGSLLTHLNRRPPGEVTLYLMPSAVGPCRFGQYHVFTRKLLERLEIPDAAVFATCSTEGYGGLGGGVTLAAWQSILVGDLFEEMRATILAGAKDPEEGMAVLEREFALAREANSRGWKELAPALARVGRALAGVGLKRPYAEIPKLSLVGEIFVRHDPIARQGLVERMARAGFILRTSPITEWMKYTDWLIKNRIEGAPDNRYWLRAVVKWWFDARIRRLLSASGLVHAPANVGRVVKAGSRFISPMLSGEAILTVGAAFHEIMDPSCGIISIGPFGCMPARVAEAVLTEKFTSGELETMDGNGRRLPGENRRLPFLAIETDGNPFPQLIEARLEAFCLQAARLHREMGR